MKKDEGIKVEAREGEIKDKKENMDLQKEGLYHFSKSTNRHIPTKFEGKGEDLKGNIYDCSDARQSDLFAKTTKEISGYVGRTYKNGGNICLVVKNIEMVAIDMPKDPPEGATRTKNRIWEMSMSNRQLISKRTFELYTPLCWGHVQTLCNKGQRQWTHLVKCLPLVMD